jgi:hypothetical protein
MRANDFVARSAIAVYSFTLERWFYWNPKSKLFDLLEQEPGKLTRTTQTPILLDFDRTI